MTLADALEGFPRRHVDPGGMLRPHDVLDTALIFVDEGLIVLRSIEQGSTRRTITCHAGSGSLVLPPEPDEILCALTDVDIVAITNEQRAQLLGSAETAGLLVDGIAETLRQKHAAIASMSRLHHVDRVREKLIDVEAVR